MELNWARQSIPVETVDFLSQSPSSDSASTAVVAAWIAAAASIVVTLINMGYDARQRAKDRADSAASLLLLGMREDLASANSLEVEVDHVSVGDSSARSIIIMNLGKEPLLDVSLRCADSAHVLMAPVFHDGEPPTFSYGEVRHVGVLHPGSSLTVPVSGVTRTENVDPVVRFMLPSGRCFVYKDSHVSLDE